MIRGVGQDGSLARAAIEAALRAQDRAARDVESRVAEGFRVDASGGADAGGDATGEVREALAELNGAFDDVERLPLDMAAGGIRDFSELAGRLKQSELTFKFALEVRNKLIDAYRETMRMSV